MNFLYKASPIRSLDKLAQSLSVSENFLRSISADVPSQYTNLQILKKDGTFRDINVPKNGIKILQRRINSRLFSNVEYPGYLYGGIIGRDYHKNALAHANAMKIISLDIENFYPNLKKSEVKKVFLNFLRFSEDVSEYLAEVCTLNGGLPQGACTSTHLANLVFYQQEPRIARKFETMKFVYTRLIDDITISSEKNISKSQITDAIKSVASLVGQKKFILKQAKTRVTTIGNPSDPARVTGLIVARDRKVTVSGNEVDQIKKDVHLCLQDGLVSTQGADYLKKHNKASGRVAKLQQIDHPHALSLRKDLRSVLPTLDAEQIEFLYHKIRDIKKKSKSHRMKESYHNYFYKIIVLLNVYQRTHKKIAMRVRDGLMEYKPTVSKQEILNGDI